MKNILFYYPLLLIFFTAIFLTPATAQQADPVKWTLTAEQNSQNPSECTLVFKAKIDKGYAIYSQFVAPGGPLPTTFDFNYKNAKGKAELIGKIEENSTHTKEGIDEMFEMNVKKFYDDATFKAKAKILQSNATLEIPITYMACNEGSCVRLEDFLKVTLPAIPAAQNPNSQTVTHTTNNPQTTPTTTPATTTPQPFNTTTTSTHTAPNTAPNNTNLRTTFENAVQWDFFKDTLPNKNEYILHFKANIQNGFYILSQNVPKGSLMPTRIQIDPNPDLEIIDPQPIEVSNFKKENIERGIQTKLTRYAQEVDFQQKIRLKNPNATLKGSVQYMLYNGTTTSAPQMQAFEIIPTTTQTQTQSPTTDSLAADPTANLQNYFASVFADCGSVATHENKRGLWLTFLLGFLGGLAALLTPCVFPMIPLTVSFFTKRSINRATGIRNSIIYGVSIIAIYVALGMLVTILFGSDALNQIAANAYFNLFFFAIFVIFAISFFGYYEITLPSSLANRADKASEKGGLIGIFFMAFVLALTSFSCTGPIIGTLLVQAANAGARIAPAVGMFGFALALALPFALFAAFPAWLNTLPKSGGWLNTVKVVLGFVELIFALKFLSNADFAKQWWLLPREVFLVIWILLLFALALYLFGFIRFPHDSPQTKKPPIKIGVALAALAIAAYLIPGIFCQKLTWVSGFPPPIFYSLNCTESANAVKPQTHNLQEAIDMAKAQNKPIMIDFTGYACSNCRQVEENVWPAVAPLINKYVLVSLYVDDPNPLPENEQFETQQNGRKQRINNVGSKWGFFEAQCFNKNSQPYYVLMNANGKLLNTPIAYTLNAAEYAQFLQKGLDNFEKMK